MNGTPVDVRRRQRHGPIEPAPAPPRRSTAVEDVLHGFLAAFIAGYVFWQLVIR